MPRRGDDDRWRGDTHERAALKLVVVGGGGGPGVERKCVHGEWTESIPFALATRTKSVRGGWDSSARADRVSESTGAFVVVVVVPTSHDDTTQRDRHVRVVRSPSGRDPTNARTRARTSRRYYYALFLNDDLRAGEITR